MAVSLDKTGFLYAGELFFSSDDCSGTPYTTPPDPSTDLILPTLVMLPGKTIYVPDPNAVAKSVALQSIQEKDNPCEPTSCGGNVCPHLVPAIPLVDLDTYFTPPFTVR